MKAYIKMTTHVSHYRIDRPRGCSNLEKRASHCLSEYLQITSSQALTMANKL